MVNKISTKNMKIIYQTYFVTVFFKKNIIGVDNYFPVSVTPSRPHMNYKSSTPPEVEVVL